MNYIFTTFTDEVAIKFYKPSNFLLDFPDIFAQDWEIKEILKLIELDKNGFFITYQKPSPLFLLNLYHSKIYLITFTLFKENKKNYSCFLKQFAKQFPDFKPYKLL